MQNIGPTRAQEGTCRIGGEDRWEGRDDEQENHDLHCDGPIALAFLCCAPGAADHVESVN